MLIIFCIKEVQLIKIMKTLILVYEWKSILTVLRMTSGLNAVLFDPFRLVHIILLMSVLSSVVTSAGAASRPQKNSKYTIPINLIVSMRDSINSKRNTIRHEKKTTRECSTALTVEMNESSFYLRFFFINWKKETLSLY